MLWPATGQLPIIGLSRRAHSIGAPHQHNIVRDRSASDRQIGSVSRPFEVCNCPVVDKMRQLVRIRSIQRVHPEIPARIAESPTTIAVNNRPAAGHPSRHRSVGGRGDDLDRGTPRQVTNAQDAACTR